MHLFKEVSGCGMMNDQVVRSVSVDGDPSWKRNSFSASMNKEEQK